MSTTGQLDFGDDWERALLRAREAALARCSPEAVAWYRRVEAQQRDGKQPVVGAYCLECDLPVAIVFPGLRGRVAGVPVGYCQCGDLTSTEILTAHGLADLVPLLGARPRTYAEMMDRGWAW